jgi:hypothetical protein
MWKTLKVLISTESEKEINTYENIVFEDQTLEPLRNKFNKFFINSVIEIENSIKSKKKYCVKHFIKIKKNISLNKFKKITLTKLRKIVYNMKT